MPLFMVRSRPRARRLGVHEAGATGVEATEDQAQACWDIGRTRVDGSRGRAPVCGGKCRRVMPTWLDEQKPPPGGCVQGPPAPHSRTLFSYHCIRILSRPEPWRRSQSSARDPQDAVCVMVPPVVVSTSVQTQKMYYSVYTERKPGCASLSLIRIGESAGAWPSTHRPRDR